MRYALRSLARSPGFALAVIVTLALGIGANTAVFSVLRGVLLRPLPNREGDRLVYLRQSAELAGQDNVAFSVPEIIDYRTSAKTLQGVAEFSAMPFNLLDNGEPVQVQTGIITGNYFDVMGLRTVLGRTFTAGDDGPGVAPVMILTWEYWHKAFGADSSVIGRKLRINGMMSEIVGVSEQAPRFPQETDVLVNMVTSPHHLDATMVHGRSHRMTEVFARLAPNATVAQSERELAEIGTRLHQDYPADYEAAAGYKITVAPLRDALTGRAKKTLYLLMATAALVLITACANVANLVLTRSIRRERELTVRWALGADRGRLRRLLLSETAILAALGAGLGIVFAFVGLDVLVGFAQRFTPRADEIRIDLWVLAFTMITATAAALIFAFAPSLREPDTSSTAFIKSGSRITGAGKLQRILIVAQVAATVIVLSAAGLLMRTLNNLNAVDSGVRTENTLTMEVPIGFEGRSEAQRVGLWQEMRDRMASLPGVQEVGLGSNVPLRGTEFQLELKADGLQPDAGTPIPRAEFRTATPQFFRAAGIPLLKGREFEATDRDSSALVVILNESFAKKLFTDRDPIGQRVAWTGEVLKYVPISGTWRTVVGIVGDTRENGPDAPAPQIVYMPFAQGSFYGSFILRGPGAEAAAPAAAKVVRDLTPDQPIERVQTLESIREGTIAPQRLNALLVGAFGILALLIAAVGIGGVLAFFISQRTNEIGIRMSLGADAANVVRMVLADGGILLASGIGLGVAGSLIVSRFLRGLLFGVPAQDPITFGTVAFLMAAVGLAACAVPAMRAARVDPLEAMRAE
jgi:putative ABC transport system permease protein